MFAVAKPTPSTVPRLPLAIVAIIAGGLVLFDCGGGGRDDDNTTHGDSVMPASDAAGAEYDRRRRERGG